MADAATGPQVVTTGVQDQTPIATMGFGAREYADTRRQGMAEQEFEDLDVNSIVARSQVLTVDIAGKEFASNSDTRQKLQDQFLGRLGLK